MTTCFTCVNCFNSNPKKLNDSFEEAGKQRHNLVIFVLNIILNMEKCFSFYYTCRSLKPCLICETAGTFNNYQYGSYQHSLDFNSSSIVAKIHLRLREIIKLNNHFVCNIINNRFFYVSENWFSGKKSVYSVDFCLDKWEKAVESLKGRPNFRRKLDE